MRTLYKRYASGGDTTRVVPKVDWGARDLAAINTGTSKVLTPAQRDSLASTFNRSAWVNTVQSTGMDTIKSKPKVVNTLVKRFDNGGQTQTRNAVLGQNLAVGAALGSGLMDAVDNGNDLGYQGKGTVIGKGVLTGAATGASIAGPWGAAAGAVVGGISGIIRAGHQATEQTALRSRIKTNKFINDSTNSANRLATNPELLTGNQNAQYFADGGDIKPKGSRYVAFPYSSNDGMSSTYTLDLGSKAKGANGFMYNAIGADGNNRVFHESEIPQQYLTGTLQNNYAIQQYGKNGKVEKVDSLYLAPNTSKFGINLPKKADGGPIKAPLAEAYMAGGNAKTLSSNNIEMQGNTHEQGGIDIPSANANVEDGETTAGTFVFSDKLGFAQLHKPIAKAIGIIEKKPQTQDRRNALERLKTREQELASTQELYKRMHGIR